MTFYFSFNQIILNFKYIYKANCLIAAHKHMISCLKNISSKVRMCYFLVMFNLYLTSACIYLFNLANSR